MKGVMSIMFYSTMKVFNFIGRGGLKQYLNTIGYDDGTIWDYFQKHYTISNDTAIKYYVQDPDADDNGIWTAIDMYFTDYGAYVDEEVILWFSW